MNKQDFLENARDIFTKAMDSAIETLAAEAYQAGYEQGVQDGKENVEVKSTLAFDKVKGTIFTLPWGVRAKLVDGRYTFDMAQKLFDLPSVEDLMNILGCCKYGNGKITLYGGNERTLSDYDFWTNEDNGLGSIRYARLQGRGDVCTSTCSKSSMCNVIIIDK